MVAFFSQVKKKRNNGFNPKPKYIYRLYDCSDGSYAALNLRSPFAGLLFGFCILKRASFRI